jgi:hypothetical protein
MRLALFVGTVSQSEGHIDFAPQERVSQKVSSRWGQVLVGERMMSFMLSISHVESLTKKYNVEQCA